MVDAFAASEVFLKQDSFTGHFIQKHWLQRMLPRWRARQQVVALLSRDTQPMGVHTILSFPLEVNTVLILTLFAERGKINISEVVIITFACVAVHYLMSIGGDPGLTTLPPPLHVSRASHADSIICTLCPLTLSHFHII